MPSKIDLPKDNVIETYRLTDSMEETAERFGVSTSVIHDRLHSWGIDVNQSTWDIDKVRRECSNCGDTVEVQPHHADKFERTYCDQSCMAEHYTESGEWSGETLRFGAVALVNTTPASGDQ